MEHGAWSMEYGGWSMEYGAWRMEDGVWSMEYGGWSMEHTLRSLIDIEVPFSISSDLSERSMLHAPYSRFK